MRDRKTDGHRAAASRALERPIKPGHDVDHLNENKDDNAPANLHEIPHGEHSRLTQSPGRRSLRKLQIALAMPRQRKKLY